MLYDSVATFIPYRMVAQNPPFGPQVTNTNGPYQFSNPWGTVPGGNPFPLPPPGKNITFPPANAEVFLPPHIKPPNVITWNASLQHRFADGWVLSVTYLGNKTAHLWIGNETNPAVYIPGNLRGKALLQHQQHAGAASAVSGQSDGGPVLLQHGRCRRRHQRQLQRHADLVEHRFAHNYTVLANYTWSKCLGIAPVTSSERRRRAGPEQRARRLWPVQLRCEASFQPEFRVREYSSIAADALVPRC